jgi:3-keto-disaccharide hydrolase
MRNMRKKILLISSILAGVFVIVPYISAADEWQKLFDGKTLNGWEKKAVHGGNGGEWAVEGGAIVADQEKDHKGGLLGTTKKYSDFEIELEFKVDNPVDTGLFLRTRDDGMGYQITIDYHDKGFIGSLYAPAEGGFIQQNKNWEKWFHKDKWNKLRARVEGQPAHVTAWLNDNLTVNFTDYKPRFPQEGYIGLQVHGGAGAWGETSKARFRNIRVRDLKDIKAETKQ